MNELEKQAHTWVRKMRSGTARAADARALASWCALSKDHANAFKEAQRKWAELLPAAAIAGARDLELQAIRHGRSSKTFNRRTFLGGAVAASSAVGLVMVGSSLGAWPSMTYALSADYTTIAGEQRDVRLSSDVTVSMNTRSSMALTKEDGSIDGVKLLAGEIAVQKNAAGDRFTVVTEQCRVMTNGANFEVRVLDGTACVSCSDGSLQVKARGSDFILRQHQQAVVERNGTYSVQSMQADSTSSWRSGILNFKNTALVDVITEINRYRPGRVVLMADGMGDQPVSGKFFIRDLDTAISQIQRLFHFDVRSLPGGIVILR